MTDIPKNFCMAPWVHAYIMPNGGVFPCCTTPYNDTFARVESGVTKLEDYYNTPKFKKIRQEFMAGKRPASCSDCWKKEDGGVKSERIKHFKKFEKHFPEVISRTSSEGVFSNPKLKYLDIRESNLCNYKCRMCATHSSSKWMAEELILNGKVDQAYIKASIDPVTGIMRAGVNYSNYYLSEVEEIHFAGGEPLIMQETYDMIEALKTQRPDDYYRVDINIITNTSKLKWKSNDILELIKDFHYVGISCSIDGMGLRHDYLRNGGVNDWHRVEQNIQTLVDWKEELSVHNMRRSSNKSRVVRFHSTVTWANLYHWWDLYEQYHLTGKVKMITNFSLDPIGIGVDCLPTKELHRAIDFYKSKPESPAISDIITFLKAQVGKKPDHKIWHDLKRLKKYYTILDGLRNQDFCTAFPEWSELWEEIGDCTDVPHSLEWTPGD